jgi:Holliday junction resolvase-like predicted endonuclease
MITKEDLAQAILDLKRELQSSQEKSDRRLDKVAKLVGNISNNQGDIAEEFFYNSLSSKPTLNGIKYDFCEKNTTRKKGNIEDEYDILMINGKDIAIIEIKYKAHTKDIEKLANKKYKNFKALYPEYTNYNHHLALASFNINEDVKEKAKEENIMLLQRKGDIVEIIPA